MEQENPNNKVLLQWEALEYEPSTREENWFYTIGIVAIIAIVLSIIFKNFLFAIIILLSAFTLIMYELRPPRLQTIKITAKGIQVEKELFPFGNILSFAITDGKPARHLIININRLVLSKIHLSLGETDPEKIRQILIQRLKETEHKETVIDLISDRLGF